MLPVQNEKIVCFPQRLPKKSSYYSIFLSKKCKTSKILTDCRRTILWGKLCKPNSTCLAIGWCGDVSTPNAEVASSTQSCYNGLPRALTVVTCWYSIQKAEEAGIYFFNDMIFLDCFSKWKFANNRPAYITVMYFCTKSQLDQFFKVYHFQTICYIVMFSVLFHNAYSSTTIKVLDDKL